MKAIKSFRTRVQLSESRVLRGRKNPSEEKIFFLRRFLRIIGRFCFDFQVSKALEVLKIMRTTVGRRFHDLACHRLN